MNSSVAGQSANCVWQGVYATWTKALEAAQELGGKGLSGEAWFRRITEQLNDYRDEIRTFGVAMPPRPCSLPMLCACVNPQSIVDFGGSSGWCWDYLRDSGSGDTVTSYVVVETPEVVKYMKSSALQISPVSYRTLDEPIEASDVLYCNSVLQYFGSNDAFLALVERSQPKSILLEDLVAGTSKDFYTIQRFRGSAIPYRFLGVQALLDDLAALGYFSLSQYPYLSPINGVVAPLPMENLPSSMQLRYSSSVLLERATPE